MGHAKLLLEHRFQVDLSEDAEALLAERMAAAGVELRRPRPGLCTDNGAMIAALGVQVVKAGLEPSSLDISANSGLPVETILV